MDEAPPISKRRRAGAAQAVQKTELPSNVIARRRLPPSQKGRRRHAHSRNNSYPSKTAETHSKSQDGCPAFKGIVGPARRQKRAHRPGRIMNSFGIHRNDRHLEVFAGQAGHNAVKSW